MSWHHNEGSAKEEGLAKGHHLIQKELGLLVRVEGKGFAERN